MYRIIKIALIIIGLLSAVLWFFMPDAEDPAAIASGSISGMFIIMFVLLAVAALMAIVFGLSKMLTTSGGLKKALFALGGLVILFIIGYAISSGDEAKAVVDTMGTRGIETTESTVKNIGMLLNVFFGMTFVAVLLMLWPGVKRLIGR